jgi:hypothetical protein
MRIVSWNCCDAVDRKFGHLERLKPDIAIVSEVRPSCLQFAGLTSRSLCCGEEGQKGLALVCYGDWHGAKRGPEVAQQWFISAIVSNGARTGQVVGAWLKPDSDYVSPTKAALVGLKDFMAQGPTVIAGDLNQSVTWDGKVGSGRRFCEIVESLHAAGLESAWHKHRGEAHGRESAATQYWRWDRNARFHIDFVFYPTKYMHITNK